MKKVMCIISDRQNNYIFDIYLIKEKRGKANIINKIPFGIDKKDIVNIDNKLFEKTVSDFRKLLYESLYEAKFVNTHLIISIDTKDIIRETINIPDLSYKELKLAIDIEISKRYNGEYIKYISKRKKDDYWLTKTMLLKKNLKEFIDKVFLPLPFNIKGISFLGEVVFGYLYDDIKTINNQNSIYVLDIQDKYIISVVIDGILMYTYTEEKDKSIESRIISLYKYYEKDLKKVIYFYTNSIVDFHRLKETLIEKGFDVHEVIMKDRIDINSLLYRKNYDYEKI